MSAPATHPAQTLTGTKKIAVTALFCAVAIVLSFIALPIFPAASFLTYDPSSVAVLFAGLAFGPQVGLAVAVISWLPHVFTATGPIGALMAILNAAAFVLPAALVYGRKRDRAGSLIGMVVGALLACAVSVLANLALTPLYMGVPLDQVVAMVAPILIPFNLLKGVINVVLGQVLLAPLMGAVEPKRAAAPRAASSK